ncbi:hypothetical protein KVV02_003320 [Mortierella alpina]|uniref:C2 domain-containing protein n=1 Tax=Mortierella alpina TaxID=64518 RepID=A0A9P8A3X9_MORAP|nr:hypothetical protein KVV02_003320 [Mortierella alpina]
MNSHRGLPTPQSASASSSASSSPSFFKRPVFASDLVAQKTLPPSANKAPFSSTPRRTQPQAPAQSQSSNTRSSSTTTTSGSGVSSSSHSMMDLSAKLSELPAIHLPDFHLPDLHRLKQQLHKHTPSFSLKSLQHTFHVPSYTSSSSSSLSSLSSATNDSSKARRSLSYRLSRASTAGSSSDSTKAPSMSSTLSLTAATPSSTPDPVSTPTHTVAPISIPTHPSNYLVKKQSAASSGSEGADKAGLVDPVPSSSTNTVSTAASTSSSASKSPVGHLYLQIIEARNLTLINPPALSRPYCLVEYDQNELMTPPALMEADSMGRRGGNDIFARAMAASSPKWRHDAEFDVVRPNQQISITIYDSGTDDDQEPAKRFLGQVKLKPSEIHNRMIDSWFRLQGRGTDEEVTGEVRVTIKYQAVEAGSFLLQQQQRAANLYRQQQKRNDNSTLHPSISRGRRSSNSWSSYRTPSNDSLFTLSEPGSPSQTRSGNQQALHRTMTAHKARALQQQHQQQQQRQQQEYFKGFTFEGESILETLKRQEDEKQQRLGGGGGGSLTNLAGLDGEDDEHTSGMRTGPGTGLGLLSRQGHQPRPTPLFNGDAGSYDSIFGSSM